MLPGADEYLQAFYQLNTDRAIGQATGPIPFSAVDRWATRFGIVDPDDFADLWAAISAMDAVWLEKQQPADPSRKTISSRPLTPELFDAMMAR